jgi:outer membrane lipoprotein carrier protein
VKGRLLAGLGTTVRRRSGRVARRTRELLFGIALACVATSALAGGLEQLQGFLDGTKSGRAAFTQVTSGRAGKPAQQASGTFVFARPGKFRWTYEKPIDQLIVGDGRKLWIHDRDLNQVIVRDQTSALGATPAALLAGDNTLERNFTLVSAGSSNGLDWVDATPKTPEAGFTRVRIGFRDDLPREMELTDTFGQTTRLAFTSFERNPAIDPREFRFVVPEGADVIGDRK